VVITALRPAANKNFAELKPTIIGLVAAAAFALSAVGFRGLSSWCRRVVRDRGVLHAGVRAVRADAGLDDLSPGPRARRAGQDPRAIGSPSMLAGFMGAFASQFLVPGVSAHRGRQCAHAGIGRVLFAQAVAYYSFKQPVSARELSGIALIVVGVAMLVAV